MSLILVLRARNLSEIIDTFESGKWRLNSRLLKKVDEVQIYNFNGNRRIVGEFYGWQNVVDKNQNKKILLFDKLDYQSCNVDWFNDLGKSRSGVGYIKN